jgi:hypothetical protein
MTKAILLPTPGDPFLNKLWFNLFESRWQKEVDKVYILLNSKIENSVVDFIRKFYTSNPKVVFLYENKMMEHGWAIKKLVLNCKEELVMLAEDDGLIFKSGALEEQFQKIEKKEFDVIGGHRCSATPGISERVKYTYYCEGNEPFLWPCFLFTRLEYLKKTDLVFGAKGFKKGDYIKELDWIVDTNEEAMDTFGWAAIQLYSQGLNIDFIEQYHAMAEDLQFYEHKQRMWDGNCKWIHFGSLSGMMTNWLIDDNNLPLESRNYPETKIDKLSNTDDMTNPGVRADFESRVAHTWLAFEVTKNECNEISEFREQYEKAIIRLIGSFSLNTDEILRKMKVFKELLGI